MRPTGQHIFHTVWCTRASSTVTHKAYWFTVICCHTLKFPPNSKPSPNTGSGTRLRRMLSDCWMPRIKFLPTSDRASGAQFGNLRESGVRDGPTQCQEAGPGAIYLFSSMANRPGAVSQKWNESIRTEYLRALSGARHQQQHPGLCEMANSVTL